MKKVHEFFFTINNPQKLFGGKYDAEKATKKFHYLTSMTDSVVAIICQLEKGEEKGTYHIQGGLKLRYAKTLSALRKYLQKLVDPQLEGFQYLKYEWAHVVKYCSKKRTRCSDTLWFPPEEKFPKKGQGNRSDLTDAYNTLRKGGYRAVAREHPETFIKYHKGLSALELALLPKERTAFTKLTIVYGDSGLGKSTWVKEQIGNRSCAWKMKNNSWYNPYRGEQVLVLDEFLGDMNADELLTIFDWTPFTVPVKGDTVPFLAEEVFITTNYPYESWPCWAGKGASLKAFERRLKEHGRLITGSCGKLHEVARESIGLATSYDEDDITALDKLK